MAAPRSVNHVMYHVIFPQRLRRKVGEASQQRDWNPDRVVMNDELER